MKSNTLVAIVFASCMIAIIIIMATLQPRPTPENPMLPDTLEVILPDTAPAIDTTTEAHHNAGVVTVHDTVIIHDKDTIYLPQGSPLFYVESDTVRQDSSWFMARYYLDPIDQFKFSYKIYEKTVVKEIEIPGIQFKSGFGLSMYAGYGYQGNTKKFGWQTGIGITYGW